MRKKFGTCCLCGQKKKLCRAHILPEAFYEKMVAQGYGLMGMSLTGDSRPRRRPIGAYDYNVLCAECDNSFEDSYAADLLQQKVQSAETISDSRGTSFVVRNFDYDRLMLFLISLIWRNSISGLSSHELDPKDEENAKEAILKRNPDLTRFEAIIARAPAKFDSTHIMTPVRSEVPSGVTIWVSRSTKFNFMVKVSDMDWPNQLMRDVAISRHKPLIVPIFTDGHLELKFMQELVENNEKYGVFK